mgnify:CR=1 FL=1
MSRKQILVWRHQPWLGKHSDIAVQCLDDEYELHNLIRDFQANGARYIYAGPMEDFIARLGFTPPMSDETEGSI